MERELGPGGQVWVKLPYGEFMIDSARDAVLFAGGTGVTAFTAFVQSLPPDNGSRVALFYGARTPDLFVYGPLAEARAREVSGLTYVPVCEETAGRLSVEGAWPAIVPMRDPIFYLSGPPAMLDALTGQLLERQIAPDRIRTDAWE
jgi:ferredoxin-NADP reductase